MTSSYIVGNQPEPIGGGDVVGDLVLEDLRERMEFGRSRYGTYLRTNNGRDALKDLYEELIDATLYVRQLIAERDSELERPD